VKRWFLAGMLAMPLAVLAHEAGHFIANLVLGMSEVVLHYTSTTHAYEDAFWLAYTGGDPKAAALLIAPWKVALASAAGLLVTYGMTLLAAERMARAPHPLAAALTLGANLRALPAAVLLARTSGTLGSSDEARLAALTGIPEVLLVLAALASLGFAAQWTFRHIPPPDRGVSFAACAGGLVAGFVVWALAGPFVLP
jgi:hypothetical protein